ncbi:MULTISPECIES: DUF6272 family protein [Persicobacter]|uniref:Uncharacterized protein n=1 Tax=Persicobacter diffluens TaxID=981 RepID=A0AAN5ALG5_9BACT|nr:DUF6272 family protein [Persicobacter sp. CCB-QB2]GJM61421.1 hypothetical protein PEDI_19730 [Persicobacter diffluens]
MRYDQIKQKRRTIFWQSYPAKLEVYGPFNSGNIGLVGNYLRVKFGDNSSLWKRAFSIYMELVQNISNYSAVRDRESEAGVGLFKLEETETHLEIWACNEVNKADLSKVEQKGELINQLGKEGLRKMKRAYLLHADENRPNSGNIGIIQVAIKAQGPITFDVEDIDDRRSLLSIFVKLEK